jgi:hypothetical protein
MHMHELRLRAPANAKADFGRLKNARLYQRAPSAKLLRYRYNAEKNIGYRLTGENHPSTRMGTR